MENKNKIEIKAKQTILDDSASIYEKREEQKSIKKTWKELSGKERWTFFKDYYLLKIIIGVVVIGMLTNIGITVFGPHTEEILSVAVLMDELNSDSTQNMTKELTDLLETDKHHIVNIDSSYFFAEGGGTSYTGDEKLSTLLYSGIIDVIVADEANFKKYGYFGNLKNLDLFLPDDMKEALEDKLLTANVQVDDSNKKALDEAMVGKKELTYEDGTPCVMGIDLSDCKKYKALKGYQEHPILTITHNSPNPENTLRFIRYLFDLPEPQ